MSEEQNVETNDGTWSGLKKTIIATLTTLVTAGGVWLSTQLFGGKEESSEPHPVQQAAPVININNTQQQTATAGGTTTIIKEKVVEKSAPQETKKAEPKQDELKTKEPQW
jgi:hypothetical protein